jgi:hypothetical protein
MEQAGIHDRGGIQQIMVPSAARTEVLTIRSLFRRMPNCHLHL